MVGWLTMDREARGWRCRCEQETVCGLPLLRAAVPAPEGIRLQRLERRIAKAARRLSEAGCRRVLTSAAFSHWDLLTPWSLRPVEPGRLCQVMAEPLVLAALEQRGLVPARSTVELRCARVERACFEAAVLLCPQVRQLMVYAPDGGAELGDYLREEYGVAVVEGGQSPDLTACFSTIGEEPVDALRLYGLQPELQGIGLVAKQHPLPEEVDPLALTALLWEEGRVPLDGIAIIPARTPGNPLDRPG